MKPLVLRLILISLKYKTLLTIIWKACSKLTNIFLKVLHIFMQILFILNLHQLSLFISFSVAV